LNFYKQYAALHNQLNKIRSFVKKADADGFFTHNSIVGVYFGTLFMMASLVQISGGINLMQSSEHRKANLAMINTLIAGVGGALGTFLFRWLRITLINKSDNQFFNEVTFDQPWKKKSYESLKKKTFYMNIYATFDSFLICRGVIAGMVSVSLNPSMFYSIFALLNGVLAGVLYVFSLEVFQTMKIDDTVHSSSVHGITSLYALLSICFFHKEEGFFFKDIYLSFKDQDDGIIAPIILVLGSNTLASFAVGLLTIFMCLVVFRLVMSPIRRVSKVQEIIG
jgi:ammonia channel protein AmtB